MGIKIAVCILAAVLVIVVLLSAGCITTKIPPVSKDTHPAIFVDYHKSGGVAGADNRLVIFDNGQTIYAGKSTGTEIVLNTKELEDLKTLFNQSQFLELEGSYSAPREYTDLFTYSITYEGKTVTAEDTAVPPRLQKVIESLDGITERADSSNATDNTLHLVNLTP
ncbi:MAG: hypothetical protein WC342_04180 [Methanoregula sp.]|jgi:hypothetical protein